MAIIVLRNLVQHNTVDHQNYVHAFTTGRGSFQFRSDNIISIMVVRV